MIDVSGNYPKEKIPALVKTAKAIVARGSCENISCENCPASCLNYHPIVGTCVGIKGGKSTESIAQEWFKKFIKEYNKEAIMDKKEQARKELAEIMHHAEALKAIIDEPESDPHLAWIGKWGFYSNEDSECPDDGFMCRLASLTPEHMGGGFVLNDGMGDLHWRYFRPATPEELGTGVTVEVERTCQNCKYSIGDIHDKDWYCVRPNNKKCLNYEAWKPKN